MYNLKFSDYVIVVRNFQETGYNVIQGYLGNFDVFDLRLGKKILDKDYSIFDEPDHVIEYLKKRGYLCSVNEDEEKWVEKVGDILHRKASEKYHISIIPTYECNFQCTYCYEEYYNARKKGTMNKTMVDKIFSTLEKLDGEVDSNIGLFGGEPLLSRNEDLIRYIVHTGSQYGYHFYAASNGFDIEYFDDILNPANIFMVQTTLDGTSEYHNLVRYFIGKKPTFDKIVQNVNRLLQNNVKVTIRTNVSKRNLDELPKLIEFYYEQGWLKNLNFNYYFSPLDNCANYNSVKIFNQNDIYSYLEQFENLPNKPVEIVGIYSNLYRRMKQYKEDGRLLLLQSEACQGNRNGLYIDYKGDLYTCCNLVGTQYICGNIEEKKLIFKDSYWCWNKRTVSVMEKCRRCKYALFCGGGCTAKAVRNEYDIMEGNCGNMKSIINECIRNL